MSTRQQFIGRISESIGNRELLWFGVRGSDASVLLEIEQFARCFSLISPLSSPNLEEEVCLETIQKHRVDINAYTTDNDNSREVSYLHSRLLSACERPSVLVTYRPGALLTSAYLSRGTTVEYLGMFQEYQSAFENKPWVEKELQNEGIITVPWQYFTTVDLHRVREIVRKRPQVLRSSRSDGGSGFLTVKHPNELPSQLPFDNTRMFSMAPYLESALPLNVSACVFPSGIVTIHAPSLQLIGLPSCTGREFSYCGNDFARVRDLDRNTLDALEVMTLKAGSWLHRRGYIGAFGIDALLYHGQLYLSEINPRFQGSSASAARLEAHLGIPDIFIAHIGAFLGFSPPPSMHIRDLVNQQGQVAQLYCYNKEAYPLETISQAVPPSDTGEVELLPASSVSVESNGMLFRFLTAGPVTADGVSLERGLDNHIQSLISSLFTKTS